MNARMEVRVERGVGLGCLKGGEEHGEGMLQFPDSALPAQYTGVGT